MIQTTSSLYVVNRTDKQDASLVQYAVTPHLDLGETPFDVLVAAQFQDGSFMVTSKRALAINLHNEANGNDARVLLSLRGSAGYGEDKPESAVVLRDVLTALAKSQLPESLWHANPGGLYRCWFCYNLVASVLDPETYPEACERVESSIMVGHIGAEIREDVYATDREHGPCLMKDAASLPNSC